MFPFWPEFLLCLPLNTRLSPQRRVPSLSCNNSAKSAQHLLCNWIKLDKNIQSQKEGFVLSIWLWIFCRSSNPFSKKGAPMGAFLPNWPLPFKFSRGQKLSFQDETNGTYFTCGQVIEASCSSYRRAFCIYWVHQSMCACEPTGTSVCAARTFTCGECGQKGFPACLCFSRGHTEHTLPLGRAVSLTSKHLRAAMYSTLSKTTGSSERIRKSGGRQGACVRGFLKYCLIVKSLLRDSEEKLYQTPKKQCALGFQTL